VHLLQIWIRPERLGITPGYEQKDFAKEERQGRLRLVASYDAAQGSVKIHQNVSVYASLLDGESVTHDFAADRYGWLQVARGAVDINGEKLEEGDGAAIANESKIAISGRNAEILLFDLN
jgi:redox-sensitive bicupin YhaK (pirin superfamily)